MAFDEIAGQLDYPMVIVTTAAREERAGCLVGFHSQCGINPARYAIWISKANHTFRVATGANMFGVHFLDERARDLAVLFGTTSDDSSDKFARCRWSPGPNGVPLLDDCTTRMLAQRVASFDCDADHVCIVVAPITVEMSAQFRPLMFSSVKNLDAAHDASE
jgi:flavin reductase (DIM6/NTAB) family NADH-FMN oxidoreductase RutF